MPKSKNFMHNLLKTFKFGSSKGEWRDPAGSVSGEHFSCTLRTVSCSVSWSDYVVDLCRCRDQRDKGKRTGRE